MQNEQYKKTLNPRNSVLINETINDASVSKDQDDSATSKNTDNCSHQIIFAVYSYAFSRIQIQGEFCRKFEAKSK